MAKLLIVHKFKKKRLEHARFQDIIDEFPNARISNSCFVIDTKLTPKQIYRELRGFISDTDSLFVMTVSSPWHGRGENEVVDWMTKWF